MVSTVAETTDIHVTIMDDLRILAEGHGRSGEAISIHLDQPQLWTPLSPKLYNLTVIAGDDRITAYTGFRTIQRGRVGNITRPLLNGEFVFAFGPLERVRLGISEDV